MHKTSAVTLALILIGASPAFPQEKPAQKPAEAQAEQPAPRPAGQLANVGIDLTITDERGGVPVTTKTVTMLVADSRMGRVRTSSQSNRAHLNVDARPQIVRDGRILLDLTLVYTAEIIDGDRSEVWPPITSTMNVILDNGKPLVISQSADPSTDRRVKVEATATILK